MPIVNNKYVNPGWSNDSPPPLDSIELNAISDTVEKVDSAILDQAGVWRKIASYETAGAYNWTAPDLFDGNDYIIGVMVIGGGESGSADTAVYSPSSSSKVIYSRGGNSGESECFLFKVHPTQEYNILVGSGGESQVSSYPGASGTRKGKPGGTSSFNGIIAYGGSAESYHGGQVSFGSSTSNNYTPFGGIVMEEGSNTQTCEPVMCFNPFESERFLGAGGFVSRRNLTSSESYRFELKNGKGGKSYNGLGGGNGMASFNISGDIKGYDATAPGCGGGAALNAGKGTVTSTTTASATSGKGADGAVYIYASKSLS